MVFTPNADIAEKALVVLPVGVMRDSMLQP